MNTKLQKVPTIPIPGLTLDTLGLYLAALGLLRVLSRKWPSVRGCWRDGTFHVITAEVTIDAINKYLLSLQRADWSPFHLSNDLQEAIKQTKEKFKPKLFPPINGIPATPLLLHRTRISENKLLNFDTHVVASHPPVKNPLLSNPGGQRDLHKKWQEVLTSIGTSPTRKNDLRICLTGTRQGKITLDKWNAANWFPYANKIYNYVDSSRKKTPHNGGTTSWSVAFAVEGIAFVSGSANKRLGSRTRGEAAFPFMTQPAAPLAERDCGRTVAEFWAPVWFNPRTVAETAALFQSARAEIGTTAAKSAGDFAAAVISKGIDFGIDEFRRFVLSHSTSKMTHEFALASIMSIGSRDPTANPEAMRRIVAARNKLPRDEKKKYAGLQGSIDQSLISLAEAVGDDSEDLQIERSWQLIDKVFASLAKVDRNKTFREKEVRFELFPLDWLSWLLERTAHQHTEEIRLALSIASLLSEYQDTDKLPQRFLAYRLGSIGKGRDWQIPKNLPLRRVWSPKPLTENLIALGKRRLFESLPDQPPPFQSEVNARLVDALQFLSQGTDDDVIDIWLSRFSLFDWSDNKKSKVRLPKWVGKSEAPEPNNADALLYGFFRPLFDQSAPSTKAYRLKPIVFALDRGDVTAAWESAAAVYRAERIALVDFQKGTFSHRHSNRLLASLFFPLNNRGLKRLFDQWRLPNKEFDKF